MSRRITKEIEGITFTRRNDSQITAGASWIFNVEEDPQLAKYGAFDVLSVNNFSVCNIEIRVNQDPDKSKYIAPNTGVDFEYPNAVHGFKIANRDTTNTINANELEIIFTLKGANADKLAKKILRWIP